MKSFIAACLAAVIIAVCGHFVLDSYQKQADEAYLGAGAKI